jgi:hypothetical protein
MEVVMPVISASALRAYGISKESSSQNKNFYKPKSEGAPVAPPAANISASTPAAVVQTSQAIATDSVKQSPQKVEAAGIKASFFSEEEDETPLPDRAKVEGAARRYLKAMGKPSPSDGEVRKVVDFYGTSQERASRLSSLVKELEADAGDVSQETVAIA